MGSNSHRRICARCALLVTVVTGLACGNSSPQPGGDALTPLDEALFDCRATTPPERRTQVPLDCILDPHCATELVTGHRGVGGNLALFAPENSVSAVRLAILLGIDAVEVDVRTTSDNGLILMHDSSTLRTTGVDAEIEAMTVAEVIALPLLTDDFPADLGCEVVPTFAEVLMLAKDRINLIVDTKTDRADLVAEAIRDNNMIDQAFVSVSDANKAVAARTAVPEVRVQIRPNDVAGYEGMIELFDRHPEIVEVPAYRIDLFTSLVRDAGSKLFADCFVEDAFVLLEGDTDYYLELYAAGANILQSEFPTWVLDVLERRYWSELPAHRDIEIESPMLPSK